MEVTCKKCGSVDNYRTEIKSTNKVAYCNNCGEYIKNLPYDVPKLYVGKYKGIPITEIQDINYLEWAVENLRLSSHIKMAILSQISHIEHLYK